MSAATDFRIRTMRCEDLGYALDLAASEGWNPGLHDAQCFLAADPRGFLLGELRGRRVGCISAVAYGTGYGFVGLYIVEASARGRGYGLRLWNAALARLSGRNIGLDGVVAQQRNYARSGFRRAYSSFRYRRIAEPAPIHPSIVPAARDAFDAIRAYDRVVFPAARDAFLRCWITQPHAGVFVAGDNGRVEGYTVVRRCRDGWKIGPLAADDAVVARRLYDAAVTHATPGAPIFIDVPTANPASQRFVTELGLTVVFETARMYTGIDPLIDVAKSFGVTTFELG